jgi:predicted RNA-binding Zn ribbon-like protein
MSSEVTIKHVGMNGSKAPSDVPAPKVGDHLALDFLNSVASPRGAVWEWLGDGPALLAWLTDVGVLEEKDKREALDLYSPDELEAVAAEARKLREWSRRLIAQVKAKGSRAVGDAEIAFLNRFLDTVTLSPYLCRDKRDRVLHIVWEAKRSSAMGLLAPLAEAVSELLSNDLSLVSQCENTACSIWFYDRTKSHHRRWCSQALCGNRAKVAAFRKRKGASSTEARK